MQFIELTFEGEKFLKNVDEVASFWTNGKNCKVVHKDQTDITVEESYDEVKRLLEKARYLNPAALAVKK
ncbi:MULTISPECIES: hypothetical protein [Bacillus]|uniref:Uncharacterized protein n=1 Tax=Bacillus glycinifermentans TaxID=1664069 RepID=A0AAJ3Z084_9BACI|nr:MULTISPECIES: hypothetical protein [Bacillus]MDU0070056.1 hypothetical protein [Bacillus sp. IG6]MED8017729.1 hypothetical protein [Bacillus glycinifermentans]QAT66392.1 hypothetical protein EQZ20_16795 [Bacillus glycinifermentans]